MWCFIPISLNSVNYNLASVDSRTVELKSRENNGKFAKTDLNYWTICKPQKRDGPGVRKGKRSPLACHTRCKCSMETNRNPVKVKFGINVIKLVKSLIDLEVSVIGRAAECQLTFARGRDFILFDKIPVSTIKLPE